MNLPRDQQPSSYIHGSDPAEQERLSRLNVLLNKACLRELNLRGGERILDVGCGLAQFSRAIARAAGYAARVLAIERDAEQLAEARRQANAAGEADLLDLRQGDALTLPLRDDEWGTFDIAHTRFLFSFDNPIKPPRIKQAPKTPIRPMNRTEDSCAPPNSASSISARRVKIPNPTSAPRKNAAMSQFRRLSSHVAANPSTHPSFQTITKSMHPKITQTAGYMTSSHGVMRIRARFTAASAMIIITWPIETRLAGMVQVSLRAASLLSRQADGDSIATLRRSSAEIAQNDGRVSSHDFQGQRRLRPSVPQWCLGMNFAPALIWVRSTMAFWRSWNTPLGMPSLPRPRSRRRSCGTS